METEVQRNLAAAIEQSQQTLAELRSQIEILSEQVREAEMLLDNADEDAPRLMFQAQDQLAGMAAIYVAELAQRRLRVQRWLTAYQATVE